MRSPFRETQARARNKVGNYPGDQNFAGRTEGHDASGGVNAYSRDIAAPDLNLAGMETGAQLQAHARYSGGKRQGATNCATGSIKHRKDAITCCLNQSSAILRDKVICGSIMFVENAPPELIT